MRKLDSSNTRAPKAAQKPRERRIFQGLALRLLRIGLLRDLPRNVHAFLLCTDDRHSIWTRIGRSGSVTSHCNERELCSRPYYSNNLRAKARVNEHDHRHKCRIGGMRSWVPRCGDTVELHVVAVINGIFGGILALLPTVLARLAADMSVLGTSFGTAFTMLSIAMLISG